MKNGKQALNMMVKKAINKCILNGWNWREHAAKLIELLVNANSDKFDQEDLAYMLGQLEIIKGASEAEIVDEVPEGTVEAEKVADEKPNQDGLGIVSVGGNKKAAGTAGKNIELRINLNDVLDTLSKIDVEKAAEVAVSSLIKPALAGFMKGGLKEAEAILTGKASTSDRPTHDYSRSYRKDPDFIGVLSSFFK